MDQIPIVVVVMGSQRYGLPIYSVGEVVRMVAVTPLPEASEIVDGVINVRGKTVPVVNLSRRLGLPPPPYDPDTHLLLLNHGEQLMAVPVDDVLGVRTLPSASLILPANVGPHSELLTGVAEMGEESLLVLDPVALFTEETLHHFDAGSAPATGGPVPAAEPEMSFPLGDELALESGRPRTDAEAESGRPRTEREDVQ
ncbi:MAG TPA: chemotaxis protein CheW [Actinomycetota bacterium]|nr:chemotaxis protein CheW [Actinomycetota bacterium]